MKKLWVFFSLLTITSLISSCDLPSSQRRPLSKPVIPATSSIPLINKGPAATCPAINELIKDEQTSLWGTQSGHWKSFTPSSAHNILSFIGAQWVGVKLGSIICLYKTDEEISFPAAIEQTKNRPVLEPSIGGWSALVAGRRLCKSTNIADCPFYLEPTQKAGDLYQEIRYNPMPTDN